MSLQELIYYPDDVLAEECEKVETFEGEIIQLVSDLKDTLQHYGGLGLAAPQIGVTKRVFILNQALLEDANTEEFDAMVFVNPSIEEEGGEDSFREGCLSMPGVSSKVKRPVYTKVKAQNVLGEPFHYEATGYTSAAIHHEFDHLNGIMYTEHLSRLKKRIVMKKYRKVAKKQGLVGPRKRRG